MPKKTLLNGILITLVVFLVAKDTIPIGDRYIMRGIAEVLCLLYGGLWVFTKANFSILFRYALFFLYTLILFCSSAFSADPIYVGIQTVSYFSIVIISVVLAETQQTPGHPPDGSSLQVLLTTTLICYSLVCIVSILAIWLLPQIAYTSDEVAGGRRFSGLFSRPGMLASAAGILWGIALFEMMRAAFVKKVFLVISAVSGIACVFLASARTFWVALIAATAVTAIVYLKRKLLVFGLLAIAGVLIYLSAVIFEFGPTEREAGKYLRTESISSLTGRVTTWTRALNSLERSPYFGFGYTMGIDGLEKEKSFQSRGVRRKEGVGNIPTLHNGYIQALMDSGIIGGAVYTIIIILAIFRILLFDKNREMGIGFYTLIFLATANFGESVILGAGTLHSILFWMLCVYSFGSFDAEND